MVFAGGPDDIAERVPRLHALFGHTRQIPRMDVGGLPHRDLPHAVEPLGTKVPPRIRAEFGG